MSNRKRVRKGVEMLNYKDVVTESNSGRVYECKLTNGIEVRLQVHETCETEHTDMVLYEFDSFSDKYYRENEVAEILKEVEFEDEDSNHLDSFDSMDFKNIEKYLIQEDVYQYKSKDELTEILVALNKPIIDDGNGGSKKMVLQKDFGVVFYWSEYDDFSCYGDGFTHRVKIIEGVKLV